ncbi:unnamed protein product [Auanema sp. JU1783]|nr:unnamed protein product [Auanema sp. JU1783]
MSKKQIIAFLDRLLGVNDVRKRSLTYTIKEEEIENIIRKCTTIVMSQPVMIEVDPPLKICGDIHGQFADLLRVFNRCGFPPDTNYLFLGDYVDRGRQQLEVICLLMAYKVLYPETFFILRGNHECSSINRTYGFYEECKRRYSVKLYHAFQNFFNCLPLCAIVGQRIFAMHGGLSPALRGWPQLTDNVIKRPFDPPRKGLATDLLWSDPDLNITGWEKSSRGISYIFGADVVKKFCLEMDIDLIVRAHQVVQDGYEFFANRKLVTIFSAPKYCGEFDNNAAVMSVDENLVCSFEILRPREKEPKVMAKSKTDGTSVLQKQKPCMDSS